MAYFFVSHKVGVSTTMVNPNETILVGGILKNGEKPNEQVIHVATGI
uniref:Uncharacterized protein n=1 Tax=Candidatus Kentrum sp. LPFa TaxID=2126335 RepID=A0A450X683_9GAMM|nr:MAG: hypothetical protein BECKLPF1236A_GA0070988_100147 [Candidatus Kentron sp. LPFa]VFK24786.1 MAG: hypothetical protein BECKLPF1236C_GA0070990_100167 [Candidatus Kentron sp. LPFa]